MRFGWWGKLLPTMFCISQNWTETIEADCTVMISAGDKYDCRINSDDSDGLTYTLWYVNSCNCRYWCLG